MVMSMGRRRCARVSAACTSCAAASMLRPRTNCRVICVVSCPLIEDIVSRPAMVENSRSSGSATLVAMVSGLAPAKLAKTVMTGKSTRGMAATGSRV